MGEIMQFSTSFGNTCASSFISLTVAATKNTWKRYDYAAKCGSVSPDFPLYLFPSL